MKIGDDGAWFTVPIGTQFGDQDSKLSKYLFLLQYTTVASVAITRTLNIYKHFRSLNLN